MLTLEEEIEQLRPVLGDAAADRLTAAERRDVFSIWPELRLASWAGALLLAAAAGLVLKNNLDRIGPLALSLMIGAAAVGCYAWVWTRRDRSGPVDDYVLLLGALLLSADAAFVETQFRLFGDDWHRHFLLLAVAHGVTAYLYRSRMLLSLSITAMAAWLGIERRLAGAFLQDPLETATRAWLCSLLLVVWRAADRRFAAGRQPDFSPVFEHFAANLALAAGLLLLPHDHLRWAGGLVTIAIAACAIAWGFRTKSEALVLYAFVYGVIAVDSLVIDLLAGAFEGFVLLTIVASLVGAIAVLFAIHAQFRRISE